MEGYGNKNIITVSWVNCCRFIDKAFFNTKMKSFSRSIKLNCTHDLVERKKKTHYEVANERRMKEKNKKKKFGLTIKLKSILARLMTSIRNDEISGFISTLLPTVIQ